MKITLSDTMMQRIDRELCFTNAKGEYRKALEDRSRKLLSTAEPLLEKVLEPEERIQCITSACSPFSIMELLTTGWWISIIKRCIIVLTDRRLLHLPTKPGGKPKGSVSQVVFGDTEKISFKGLLGNQLRIRYVGGKKESFSGVPMAVARKLKALLPQRAGQGHRSLTEGRCYLCPRCRRELQPDQIRCSGCNMGFKYKKRAVKYSLLFPGGGYFYTEHPLLGVADAFAEAFLILGLGVGVFLAGQGDPGGWTVAGIFGIALLFEKMITIYHATHYVAERLPSDKGLKGHELKAAG